MNEKILKRGGALCAAALLGLAASSSQAAIVYTGPFGPTANGTVFSAVIEDNNTEQPANVPMFGAPTAINGANKIVFTPTAQFTAVSSDGHSNDPDDGGSAFALSRAQLTQVLISNPAGIGTITIGEIGDYSLLSFGGNASVFGGATATLTFQDGPQVGNTVVQDLDLNGAAAGNDLLVTDTGVGAQPVSGTWTGQTTFNVGSATSVILTLDNELNAFSTASARASISKNRVDIQTGVPEPTTAGLLAAGAFLFARRRRS